MWAWFLRALETLADSIVSAIAEVISAKLVAYFA